MNPETAQKLFLKPAEVINRAEKAVALDDSATTLFGRGCQCVNCVSCNNSCNR
jgi:hypothetical protein